MIHYSDPPVLLEDVIEDPAAVVGLLERNAPYTPLGGWYRPGADLDERSLPMWFQNDWVHADLWVDGADLFMHHKRVIETARRFYDAEVILPKSLYVNLMAGIVEPGPAHTDNPRFHGRDRTNTPMWLLRTMLWSGLFDDWSIVQATSIWWMNDVEEGGLYYWPDGPDHPPRVHIGRMANTALVGDNHGMFHQVGPVGPFDQGTIAVSGRAELAPLGDESGEWAVIDHGEVLYTAPLDTFRVSVLWKADVYKDEDERRRKSANTLSWADVERIFNTDLAERGLPLRFEASRRDDAVLATELAEAYPEAVPVGMAGPHPDESAKEESS